jgi:ubiquitin carboxyl-terminal hydrolase 6/32
MSNIFCLHFSDDSLGYEYPFVLKVVQRGGCWCAWCPWHRFCRGCALPCSTKEFEFGASYLAIDWDQTALHLRYLANQEKVIFFKYLTNVSLSLFS